MKNSLKVSATFPASAKEIYEGWLSSKGHASFTGAGAKVSSAVGGSFKAWDGYISGKNLSLKPYKKIVQAWRTTDFAKSNPDSKLEIILEESKGKTLVTLNQTNIPAGQEAELKKGWQDFYFKPMKEYFQK